MRETDLADELFGQPGKTALPAGVRVATARQGGVTITRVERELCYGCLLQPRCCYR